MNPRTILGLMLAVGLSAGGLGAYRLAGQTADPGSVKEEKPMPPSAATQAPRRAIPPIDAAAPAKVETATFALG